MSSTQFLSLNDDCIMEIFDQLSYESLCSIGQTNKRLRALAGRHFLQKNPNTWIVIFKVQNDFKITLSRIQDQWKRKYTNFFRRNIQNLSIALPSSGATNMVPFIRSNCNVNLKSIEFNGGLVSNGLGIATQDILRNVETLIFKDCHVSKGYHDNILKYCHSLRHLTLDENRDDNHLDKLLLQTYPKLEYLHHNLDGGFKMGNWQIFLQRNPIKAVTWTFTKGDDFAEWIQITMENAINLERLFLSFESHFDIQSICSNLKILCNQKQFKHLELKFGSAEAAKMLIAHGKTLGSLKLLKGLHLEFDLPFENVVQKLPSLVHLKVLQITSDIIEFKDNSSFHLPNLEELYISDDITIHSFKFIQYFIRSSAKLAKIFAYETNSWFDVDIAKLNTERARLPRACEVIIYLTWTGKTDMNHDLVKIKVVNQIMQFNNEVRPFILHYVDDSADEDSDDEDSSDLDSSDLDSSDEDSDDDDSDDDDSYFDDSDDYECVIQ